ncbi:MAG: hypothetical protein C4567_01575 [Deltaproteobacteria bacterium]|nr:MAG: hypothetical protein C4567_01575 [Deltaproteobacteria bacterium]
MKKPRPRARRHVRCVFCGAALERVPRAGCLAAWGVCLLCLPEILRGVQAGKPALPVSPLRFPLGEFGPGHLERRGPAPPQ